MEGVQRHAFCLIGNPTRRLPKILAASWEIHGYRSRLQALCPEIMLHEMGILKWIGLPDRSHIRPILLSSSRTAKTTCEMGYDFSYGIVAPPVAQRLEVMEVPHPNEIERWIASADVTRPNNCLAWGADPADRASCTGSV